MIACFTNSNSSLERLLRGNIPTLSHSQAADQRPGVHFKCGVCTDLVMEPGVRWRRESRRDNNRKKGNETLQLRNKIK